VDDSIRTSVYKTKIIGKVLGYFLSFFQFKLLSFYKGNQVVDMIKSIKSEVDLAFYPYEAYIVYSITKSQSRLEGDMAEVGVYQGGSAKIICEAKGKNTLHLFDTFSGLPPVSDKDTHFGTKFWKDNEFNNTSEEKVRKYLSKYENVHLYKGKFPETSEPIRNSKFSFVHLDVDLYQSTYDCLEFFYPRLIKGGIILTHDYHSKGVQTAFKDYFQNKKIPIIELTGSQCMIVNAS
jgi:O-methyltransferase